MRGFRLFLVLFLLFNLHLVAQDFSKMGKHPILLQKGKEKNWCHICGMNLKMFYKTNHAIKLKDGKVRQYCSIRCLAIDYPKIKDNIKDILVVDAKSGRFVDANKAFYVVGSKIKGTMSKVSKIAFLKKEDAKEFQKRFGGRVVTFEEAFKVTNENLQSDIAMLEKKKKMMIFPRGKMIYKKMCKKKIDADNFATIGELKSYLLDSKICGDLKGKKLQMLALYIKESKDKNQTKRIVVPKDAKCPVCGMFVSKYPRWATKIILDNGKQLYFDGAKDMFKYLHTHKLHAKQILVNDYYYQKAIDAKRAFFVIGSDVLGPMGNELIPFKYKNEAENFLIDHHGKKILKYDQITKEVIKKL